MKTDRELLELAAKAAGIEIAEWCDEDGFSIRLRDYDPANPMRPQFGVWNPLTDDADALRLAVKLGLRISTGSGSNDRKMTEVINGYGIRAVDRGRAELHGDDPMAATRRAITRAAAAIGESMQ